MRILPCIRYVVTAIILFSAGPVMACGVCGNNYTEAEVKAYTVITALLAMGPILGFIGLGIWFFRVYRQRGPSL